MSLTPAVARALAEREGIKATLEGEISREGDGYVLAARLVMSANGTSRAQFSERADGDGTLLDAIDRLSARIRERVGESLRSIRSAEPLEEIACSAISHARAAPDDELARGLEALCQAVRLP